MTLLDRYIIGRFLTNFVILFSLLFVFAITIDVVLQLDEFIEVARERGHDNVMSLVLGVAKLIVNFHGPRVFQFYTYLLGLVCVGAMAFTLAQMLRARELVAILASGVSMYRIAAPFIVAAFALNVVQLLNQEFILPRVAPLLIRGHSQIGVGSVGPFAVMLVKDGDGALIQSSGFDPRTGVLVAPTIIERDERWRAVRRITADRARWDAQRGGWILETVASDGTIEPGTVTSIVGANTGPDAVGLRESLSYKPIEFFPSDLTPQALLLREYAQYTSMLSLRQIGRMLEASNVVDIAALRRYQYARFASICVNLLTLTIALPFFLLRVPTPLMRQALLAAGATLPTFISAWVGMSMQLPGIPPTVGVFLPVLILAPMALAVGLYVKT